MSAAPVLSDYVVYDGLLVSHDGEIVGVVTPEGKHELYDLVASRGEVLDNASLNDGRTALREPWIPRTESEITWVMEKRAKLATKIAALKRQLEDVTARMQKEIASTERDLERFDNRFVVDLTKTAKEFLPRGKKTWVCPWGSVSYKLVPAKLKAARETPSCADDDVNERLEEVRIAWAERVCPVAVVQPPQPPLPPKKFMISQMPDEVKAELISQPEVAAKYGFVVEPAHEAVEVKQ